MGERKGLKKRKESFYCKHAKRLLDIALSMIAFLLLSPLLIVLTAVGAVAMGGDPFFVQERPGKNEKIFRLCKFRTMSNARDARGELLPDGERLNGYGRFLRSTSLDELPELWNVLKGDMSLVGPRPLLVEYLPYYTAEERARHTVRPGITGWAQVNGRNAVQWSRRFALDNEYIQRISLGFDLKIVLLTVSKVVKRENVAGDTGPAEGNFAELRRAEAEARHSLG